jgi:IS605 OrfB family transposase
LTKLTKKSGKSSDNKKSKYLVNKRKFETINLAYEIDKLVKGWKCKKVVVEDLSFKSNFKGKNLNRLCKNSWDRCLFENKLKMLSKLHGYEVVEINPCYTS